MRVIPRRNALTYSWGSAACRLLAGVEGGPAFEIPLCRGTALIRNCTPLKDATVALCLGSQGGPRELGVFLWARYFCRRESPLCQGLGVRLWV
jgi:hypothetical protein